METVWTELGRRLGYTRTAWQRDAIRAAAALLHSGQPAEPQRLHGPAVQAMYTALLKTRGPEPGGVRTATLLLRGHGRCRLVALTDSHGTRSYLLDLDEETVCVLIQRPHRTRNVA